MFGAWVSFTALFPQSLLALSLFWVLLLTPNIKIELSKLSMNKKTFFAVTTVAAIAATLFVTIPVFADFKPSDWQFKKAVRVPDISETQYVQVTVDKEVYAKSSNLGDLRVTDGSGGEVPYQLVV